MTRDNVHIHMVKRKIILNEKCWILGTCSSYHDIKMMSSKRGRAVTGIGLLKDTHHCPEPVPAIFSFVTVIFLYILYKMFVISHGMVRD